MGPSLTTFPSPTIEAGVKALRLQFRLAEKPSTAHQPLGLEAAGVRRSRIALELTASACLWLEFFYESNFQYPPTGEQVKAGMDHVSKSWGIDLSQVMWEAVQEFGAPPGDRDQAPPPLSTAGREAKAFIALCPIREIEIAASKLGMESEGFRCRRAYDSLKSFIVRADSQERERVALVGRRYAEGALSLSDVAGILCVNPADAVAILEAFDYNRPLSAIAFSEETRKNLLGRIRDDRVRRDGSPEFSRDMVLRDMIASERIEGVDARSWISELPH